MRVSRSGLGHEPVVMCPCYTVIGSSPVTAACESLHLKDTECLSGARTTHMFA